MVSPGGVWTRAGRNRVNPAPRPQSPRQERKMESRCAEKKASVQQTQGLSPVQTPPASPDLDTHNQVQMNVALPLAALGTEVWLDPAS